MTNKTTALILILGCSAIMNVWGSGFIPYGSSGSSENGNKSNLRKVTPCPGGYWLKKDSDEGTSTRKISLSAYKDRTKEVEGGRQGFNGLANIECKTKPSQVK